MKDRDPRPRPAAIRHEAAGCFPQSPTRGSRVISKSRMRGISGNGFGAWPNSLASSPCEFMISAISAASTLTGAGIEEQHHRPADWAQEPGVVAVPSISGKSSSARRLI
jgi:hypothetical protein